jgi:osmotically-inducible protein OsmY
MRDTSKATNLVAESAATHREIAATARGRLHSERRFWDTNAGNITVAGRDGRVMIHGHVASSTTKLQAEQIINKAGSYPMTQNHLVVDNDLMYVVSLALADNEQTHQEHILVSVRQGVVTLSGRASSAAARLAVEGCAAQVPTVRGISNLIGAQGIVVNEREQRVLQPHRGQEVFASDMSLGHVNRLIIDPHNRRVVAIVVQGHFPARQQTALPPLPWDRETQAQSVVIPVSTIDSISMSMVQLNFPGGEAAQYAHFQLSDFHLPDPDWSL